MRLLQLYPDCDQSFKLQLDLKPQCLMSHQILLLKLVHFLIMHEVSIVASFTLHVHIVHIPPMTCFSF